MARKRKNRLIRLVLLILIIAALLSLRYWEELGQEPTATSRWTIVKVLDGDTVELLGGEKLRLLSVDCPEIDQPFYDHATDLVRTVTLGKTARVEFSGAQRDKYGRLLGYLFVDDTLFVNKMLIDSGLASLYLFADTELGTPSANLLFAAQRDAIDRGNGIWSLERAGEPFYLSTSRSFRFHRPGCRHIANTPPDRLDRYASRLDACRDGLSPCRTCQP